MERQRRCSCHSRERSRGWGPAGLGSSEQYLLQTHALEKSNYQSTADSPSEADLVKQTN